MPRYPIIPPLSGEPADAARIHALLEELRSSFEAIGQSVSVDLQPPINWNELSQRCSWFPGTLPEEIRALYGWRGGQKLRPSNSFSPFWFRDMIFATPEVAHDEYESMMQTYGKYSEPGTSGVDLRTCFPFAAFNGGWYVFPCAGQAIDPVHPRSIFCVFQGIGAYFHTLESMLKACIDWVKHPEYQSKGRIWEEVEMEIWQLHNPGVFSRD